jgi:hypothetical protein
MRKRSKREWPKRPRQRSEENQESDILIIHVYFEYNPNKIS